MNHFTPISADVEESNLFMTLSNVFSDEQIIKLSHKPLQGFRGQRGGAPLVEDYRWNQWKDVWSGESNANFFRCFPNCCAVTGVLYSISEYSLGMITKEHISS
ncbi:MAG: hypothetical protein IBX41_08460, partial [Methanophagales archaeon]|nr:hypothetical protein [Methanophagales archaeon]